MTSIRESNLKNKVAPRELIEDMRIFCANNLRLRRALWIIPEFTQAKHTVLCFVQIKISKSK